MNAGTSADILAQALENSGLTGTSGETTAGVATVTVAGKELPAIAPVPLSEIPSNITSVTPIPMTLSTMTVHDTATGEVKKHVIRKVFSFCYILKAVLINFCFVTLLLNNNTSFVVNIHQILLVNRCLDFGR